MAPCWMSLPKLVYTEPEVESQVKHLMPQGSIKNLYSSKQKESLVYSFLYDTEVKPLCLNSMAFPSEFGINLDWDCALWNHLSSPPLQTPTLEEKRVKHFM